MSVSRGFAVANGPPAGVNGPWDGGICDREREVAVDDKQTEDAQDYAKDSPADEASEAPTGKEGITEGDKTLPDDQATFQPEST